MPKLSAYTKALLGLEYNIHIAHHSGSATPEYFEKRDERDNFIASLIHEWVSSNCPDFRLKIINDTTRDYIISGMTPKQLWEKLPIDTGWGLVNLNMDEKGHDRYWLFYTSSQGIFRHEISKRQPNM